MIALYAAVFAFGFAAASPIAHLAVLLGLEATALSVATVMAIVGTMLFLMWSFDRCVAGRVVLSPRWVRVLFVEVKRQRRDERLIRLVQ